MTTPADPESIILSRPDRIGDVVISTSVIGPTRARFPYARLYFMAQPRMAPLFEAHPALDGFVPIAQTAAETAERLRSLRAEVLIHMDPDTTVAQAGALAGIPRRIGYGARQRRWLTHLVRIDKDKGRQHEAAYAFEPIKLLGAEPPAQWRPWLTPEVAAQARAHAKLQVAGIRRRYGVLHLSAHGTKPRVPIPYFIEAASFFEKRGLAVLVVGGEASDPAIAEFESALPPNLRKHSYACLAGKLDLAETAWVLGEAAVVLSRDSGPAHLAAAMNAPIVTLMAEPEPSCCSLRWAPLGLHSYVLEKPMKRRWLESRASFAARNFQKISPQEVLHLLEQALAHTATGPTSSTGTS